MASELISENVMTDEQSAYIQKLSNFRCFIHLWRSNSSEGVSKLMTRQYSLVSFSSVANQEVSTNLKTFISAL